MAGETLGINPHQIRAACKKAENEWWIHLDLLSQNAVPQHDWLTNLIELIIWGNLLLISRRFLFYNEERRNDYGGRL